MRRSIPVDFRPLDPKSGIGQAFGQWFDIVLVYRKYQVRLRDLLAKLVAVRSFERRAITSPNPRFP